MNHDSKVHVFGNQLTSEEKHKKERSKVGRLILGLISQPDSVSDAVNNLVFDLPLGPAGLQMDRSVSVSVGVVFGLKLPPRSSGMEDESPLRPGSTRSVS